MSEIKITKELLADIKSKAEKATPGPWESVANTLVLPEHDNKVGILGGLFDYGATENGEPGFGFRNAAYIAAANPVITLALINKIEKLEKEARWLAGKICECPKTMKCPPDSCTVDDTECEHDDATCWLAAAKEAVEAEK